jgi:hypothetical protein
MLIATPTALVDEAGVLTIMLGVLIITAGAFSMNVPATFCMKLPVTL